MFFVKKGKCYISAVTAVDRRTINVLNKGAGSYSGQGGRIVRKGHPGRRRRIADSGGESCKIGILPCSVIITFC